MQNDKDIPGISCGLVENNVFEWEVMLMINDDTKFYGGVWEFLETEIFVADMLSYRWFLQGTSYLSAGVPLTSTQDALRDTNFPS